MLSFTDPVDYGLRRITWVSGAQNRLKHLKPFSLKHLKPARLWITSELDGLKIKFVVIPVILFGLSVRRHSRLAT